MNEYSLLLFDLDDTLLSSTWSHLGLIKTLEMHPRNLEGKNGVLTLLEKKDYTIAK
ncbi:hypothetical protein BACCIP111899_03036 [Bacillus rhizoplanae]|uniref:Uncharacterized protein n=1 Tax=Bacillus rhizoplanae TaxID=2880966 RepID=A0ABM8YDS6_9BACI|nr:hypothetical protein BACCIP111899_03036 [Bacillus rhizoplanae]